MKIFFQIGFLFLIVSCTGIDKENESEISKVWVASYDSIQLKSSEQYFPIHSLPIDKRSWFTLHLSFDPLKVVPEKVFVVFSCEDEKGNSLLWESFSLANHNITQHIDANYLSNNSGRNLKVYIWNKEVSNLKIKNLSMFLESNKEYPQNPLNKKEQSKALLLGHRATGSNVKSGFLENTMPAVEEALKYADGIEVDVQMSSSGTLWMYHNSLFTNLCPESQKITDSLDIHCVLSSPDNLIQKLRLCYDTLQEKIYPLEELMELLSSDKYKDKIVSLDVKGYFDQKCIPGNNVDEKYLREVNDNLYAMILKYNLIDRVIVETDYTFLLKLLKATDSNIQCFLLGYNNLPSKVDKAYALGMDGISFNLNDSTLNNSNVAYLKSKGLKLQLWTINDIGTLDMVMRHNPYSVQISKVEILQTIQESKN